MDDLHAPTVASGPTSNGATNGVSKDRLSLKELIAERDRVEAELMALSSVLDSHGVNMNTSLTTFDGFPRSDIDVPQIRTTRARIIRLKNDYKDLMASIEKGLHEHHASLQAQAAASASAATSSSSSAQVPATSSSETTGPAFAKINSVEPQSPAADAGLKAGDKVISFGSANWMNHEKLSKVAEVVSQNEGRSIPVSVTRTEGTASAPQQFHLNLTPRRNWGGRGMLGCHIVLL
ncbi:26S proteasome non-ATPase-like protein regulatory subunit 9 [Rhizodiscina lignyota]|uniref:Probable 26S proteasome regulatory subunit p27 n=1 Tax=Rhizodiscina lignyota TaxID=1504668 RepID=A0A9P4IHX3_9PEZI|nr:26S proteasome non-ATPase-like protein regulatory subunit 9 [Rhizodiscina lignyota]